MSPSQKRKQEFVRWLKALPCLDCGKNPGWWVMQFDHRPGEGKNFNIGQAMSFSYARLLNEITKCDLVCANCHAARTYRRLNA